eukprot:7006435-Prymnesium_polylepis.1
MHACRISCEAAVELLLQRIGGVTIGGLTEPPPSLSLSLSLSNDAVTAFVCRADAQGSTALMAAC